ncbi:MAG: hypothetical protein SWH61_10090 [Thermodesulfobacteriota bacterium]|nr:hypothetical protein [Thermodesulfobacteriota bacterium]
MAVVVIITGAAHPFMDSQPHEQSFLGWQNKTFQRKALMHLEVQRKEEMGRFTRPSEKIP